MGLDMYIERTTQKEWDETMARIKKSQEFETRAEELWTSKWGAIIDGLNLPKTEFGDYDFDKFTPEQSKVIDEYRAARNKIREELGMKNEDEDKCDCCDEDFKPVELGYWRKAWALHSLIVKVTNTTGEDNCVRMLLTVDMCKELIDTISKKELKSSGDYDFWGDDYIDYTVEVLNNAISAIERGMVVYYYAWY